MIHMYLYILVVFFTIEFLIRSIHVCINILFTKSTCLHVQTICMYVDFISVQVV